jgi:hypothetical protein
MVSYLVSLDWDGFIRTTIVAAFEAYGSALVGITPSELPADSQDRASAAFSRAGQKGR